MNEIGLTNFLEKYKGKRKSYKVSSFLMELKWAWQRLCKGYDDRDAYGFPDMFPKRMIEILEDFKINTTKCCTVPSGSLHYEQLGKTYGPTNERIFNRNESVAILDTMIWHLKMMDEDFVEEQIHKNGSEKYNDKNGIRILKIRMKNKECFMKLFNMFYWQLWS